MKNNKLFRMDSIFDIKKGKRLTKANMIDGNLNYIGAISDNNGVRQKIEAIKQFEGNCITVNYNGSVGEAFYQSEPFWASDDVNVLFLKDYEMNEKIAMYLITIIKANKYRFGYGRKWTKEKMSETEIALPTNKNGYPDWIHMKEFISNLKSKKITTKKFRKTLDIDTTIWKEFNVGILFEPYLAKPYHKNNLLTDEKGVPYITRTSNNNGENDKIKVLDEIVLEKSNAITVGAEGVVFFYRDKDFVCGNKISILRHPNLNKYNAMFLITILNFKLKDIFNYGRAIVLSKLCELSIPLPITKKGAPDWNYMENYIKSLPYSDRI